MPRKYTLNEHVFDTIDISEKAYWLGYLYGDGSINTHSYNFQVGLSSVDLDIIQKFLEVEALHKCGIIPRKTYDHSVSIYIPLEPLTSHFWRGLHDAEDIRLDGKYLEVFQCINN